MKRLQQENWIWLSNAVYPQYQKTFADFECDRTGCNYCVAEFCRKYCFDKKIKKLVLRVSGDSYFRLFINGKYVCEGPEKEGRDFFTNHNSSDAKPGGFYKMKRSSEIYTLYPEVEDIEFFAQVQLPPVRMNDSSREHGGFMLSALAYIDDDECIFLQTDESWLCRRNPQFPSRNTYNGTTENDPWSTPDILENIWNTHDCKLPHLDIARVLPSSAQAITAEPGKSSVHVFFNNVYTGHMAFDITCSGECHILAHAYEKDDSRISTESITVSADESYVSIDAHSIAAYRLDIDNKSNNPVIINPYLVSLEYPVREEGYFKCSDPDMNKVYESCKWATRICRQTIHLDSPMHQEPLACTGDYYIEALITAMCFGDMRLAESDVEKTADILRATNGKMFHTTYSLIWVQMLYDTYMFTGNKALLLNCADAVHILFNRFQTYIGENGIIDNPPDYMFIDWIVADGYTMHHPPKALGQTCLNAYYVGALRTAGKIFAIIGDNQSAEKYTSLGDDVAERCHKLFFDEERGIYFDGLSTPDAGGLWRPENPSKRYYSKQSNTLAVLYGLCDEKLGKSILEKALLDDTLIDVQPYFMHFVFCAIRKVGLFEKYGIQLMNKWIAPVNDFPKGLQEGWIKPQEDYGFDFSHAWGGTPAYQLPSAMLGLEMLEPGYEKIALKPQLFGYEYAYISIPTPKGYITCYMKQGYEPQISIPSGIKLADAR